MRARWRNNRAGSSAAASLTVALVALAACSSKPRQRTEGPPAEPVVTTQVEAPRIKQVRPIPIKDVPEPPEPAIALPLRESFTVQSAGDEPRRRHRYVPTAQTRLYTFAAELAARSITGDAGPTPAVPVPPFREAFALETSDASPVLQWRGDPIRVDGAAAAAAPYVARWKTLLANRRARFSLDDHALPHELTFAEDPLRQQSQPERDELTQRLLTWLAPLPEEPIGRGARWSSVLVLRQGLGVVKQTARYHLVEVAADRLVIDVDIRRVAEEQRVNAPDLPPGTTLQLLALFRGISGRLELSPSSPLPLAGRFTVEARAHQRLSRDGGTAVETITEDTGALTLTSEAVR